MIAHIFNSGQVSGPETLVLPALASWSRRVHVILLLETRLPSERLEAVKSYIQELDLPLTVIEISSRCDRRAIANLRRELERLVAATGASNRALFHAHDVKASTYLLAASRPLVRSGRCLLVSTHHGVRGRSGVIPRLYESLYTHFILPRFHRVLAVCRDDGELLVERGLRPERVVVHQNGVTREKVLPTSRREIAEAVRERWRTSHPEIGAVANQLVMGVVARLEPEKRHDLILKVLTLLKEMPGVPKFVLLCFGQGSLDGQLKRRCVELGLAGDVHWLGYRSSIGQEMAGLDLLLSFSRAEGLPINLIEAGWAATPVFASAVDGVKDLVPRSELGTLFQADDTAMEIAERLATVLKDRDALQAAGERFQSWIEGNFSQTIWLANLEKIYLALLRDGPRGRYAPSEILGLRSLYG